MLSHGAYSQRGAETRWRRALCVESRPSRTGDYRLLYLTWIHSSFPRAGCNHSGLGQQVTYRLAPTRSPRTAAICRRRPARAIDYSLKRWQALTRYIDDGDLPADNNRAENQIRPIALGRSN